jgi:hypothetical protein
MIPYVVWSIYQPPKHGPHVWGSNGLWGSRPGRDATAHAEEDPHQDGSQHGDSGPQRLATKVYKGEIWPGSLGDLMMIWWWSFLG